MQERGQVSTPELTADLVLPSQATVLGQSLDLSQVGSQLTHI